MVDEGHSLFLAIVKGRNAPGVLGDVATRMAKAGFNILLVNECATPKSVDSTATFFLEAVEPEATEERLKQALSASPLVSDFNVKKAESRLMVDNFPFPLMYFPSGRGVLFPQSGIRAMFKDLIQAFGTGGESILYWAGHSIGWQGTEDLAKALGEDEVTKDPVAYTSLYGALGWGRLEVVEASQDGKRYVMKLENGFEAAGKSQKPACHFTRGLVAGSTERIVGRTVVCEEQKCVAVGDPHCLFEVAVKGKPAPSRFGSSLS